MTERVRIVVGEGESERAGLLRFVLEGEGFEVVGQAATAAELARVLAVHRPDVVVLDDGIGATAVQMTHEVAPAAKVVLVWPSAVVPIGGDARVDPGQVLHGLGPAVGRVAGVSAAALAAMERPAWMNQVRDDRLPSEKASSAEGSLVTRRASPSCSGEASACIRPRPAGRHTRRCRRSRTRTWLRPPLRLPS